MQTINTKSKNTVAAYEFLAKNKDNSYTIAEVAEALGVSPAKVTGGLVSLAKKGILTKVDGTRGEKTYKVFQFAEPAKFEVNAAKKMSDVSVRVLQYLQQNPDADLTAKDIALEVGMSAIAVNGVVQGLTKKDLAVRETASFEMPDGEVRELKLIKITEAGKAYKF